MDNALRFIAFYLPQYHPIPENDEWWGKGFTEWTNVTKAKPLFRGHYQPHLPSDLGYYDLRLPEVRESQADLAKEYGIYGFCYYHYWFNGRRILERPFNEVLTSGKPDFPFCLCWANENWTRVWDGGSKHVLLGQNYTDYDDVNHIKELIPAFRDNRYIRIDGKPLFLVYRTENLPNPKRTSEIWREAAYKSGVGEIYLVRVESFTGGIDPQDIGFDAAVEFAPDWRNRGPARGWGRIMNRLAKFGLIPKIYRDNWVSSYQKAVEVMLDKPEHSYKWFRCVCPSFDNSARKSKSASIFVGSTPEIYGKWLKKTAERTLLKYGGEERIVFINAWNEWAEGNHLEPDVKWGRSYLEATRNVLVNSSG